MKQLSSENETCRTMMKSWQKNKKKEQELGNTSRSVGLGVLTELRGR